MSREERGTEDDVENTILEGTVFGEVELDWPYEAVELILLAGTEDEESIWTCEDAELSRDELNKAVVSKEDSVTEDMLLEGMTL